MTQPRSKRQSWSEMPPQDWAERQAKSLADEIYRLRTAQKLSAQALADRTKELGYEVSRSVISDLENGRRRYVTTAELIVLAAALRTSPVNLIYPGPYHDEVEVLPNRPTREFEAAQWFSGIQWNLNVAFTYADKKPDADGLTGADKWRQATWPLTARRQLADLHDSRRMAELSHLNRGDHMGALEATAMYDKMIRQLEQQLGIYTGPHEMDLLAGEGPTGQADSNA